MSILVIGLMLFLAPHLLRELGLRSRLIDLLPSVGAYKGLYSLLSLAGLGFIIWGKSQAAFIMIWEPLFELRFISHVLMIPALILFVAGNLPNSHLRRHLRHPMLLGVTFWGLAHLWANGDLASMLLFGSLTIWAAVKFVTLQPTPNQPLDKASSLWDIIALVGGLSLYAVIGIYHGQLFGVGLNFA